MEYLNGYVMSKDIIVAKVVDSNIEIVNDALVPLYLKNHNDIIGWLDNRSIDKHRTHSRMIKKLLRISSADDYQVALKVHACSITDNYWFKSIDENITYDDVKFKRPFLNRMALYGERDSFINGDGEKNIPSPELTNIGSFEKCWTIENGIWYLYKVASDDEKFAECFVEKISNLLNIPSAKYFITEIGIKTEDFTENGKYNFESARFLIGENYDDYNYCYERFYDLDPELAVQYAHLVYIDALCFNTDRHQENFGILRDANTGKIVSLAPNFDNNLAVLSSVKEIKEYKMSDLLLSDAIVLYNDKKLCKLRKLTKEEIEETASSIFEYDKISVVVDFILKRQDELDRGIIDYCNITDEPEPEDDIDI